MQRELTVLWLPEMFWDDHAERDLPAGSLLARRGRRVLVSCTDEELAEIRSDAAHYAHANGPSDFDGAGALKRSAAATVRAIDRVSSVEGAIK